MRMMRGPAEYLLRFDDLSPRMRRPLWARFSGLILEFQLRPILAVIPDFHGTEAQGDAYGAAFWEEMRRLEAAGATIAVHGYRHLCQSRGASLLGLHRTTEFAGVDYESQRRWIATGLEILIRQGLHPRLWVAPRHGFDGNTLRALRDENLRYLSDGFARAPVMRGGVTWIPQQLWGPVSKEEGLWTICIHPETARSEDLQSLRSFVGSHKAQFTSFERVLEEWPPRVLGPVERLREAAAQWRVGRRQRRRRTARP